MKPNYLILLDYCTGQIIKIKLTDEEKIHIDNYKSFEKFMRAELESKYNFKTFNVYCMTTEDLDERTYNI